MTEPRVTVYDSVFMDFAEDTRKVLVSKGLDAKIHGFGSGEFMWEVTVPKSEKEKALAIISPKKEE